MLLCLWGFLPQRRVCWTNCGRKLVPCLDAQKDVFVLLQFLLENNGERAARNKNGWDGWDHQHCYIWFPPQSKGNCWGTWAWHYDRVNTDAQSIGLLLSYATKRLWSHCKIFSASSVPPLLMLGNGSGVVQWSLWWPQLGQIFNVTLPQSSSSFTRCFLQVLWVWLKWLLDLQLSEASSVS